MKIEKRIVKDTFHRFLAPTLFSAILLSLFSMSNVIIAGNAFGETGLGAVGIAIPIVFTCNLISILLSKGGAVIFSNYLEKGKFEVCSKVFSMCVFGSFFLGIVLGGIGLLFLKPIVSLLGGSGNLFEPSLEYVRALLIGLPFIILSPVLTIFLRNDSKQNVAMFCVVLSCVLNVILALLAVKVLHLGVGSIGLAYALSETVSCIIASIVICKKKRVYKLTFKIFDKRLMFKIIKVGGSDAIIIILQIFLTIAVNRILSNNDAESVYTVVKNFINFLFMGLFEGINMSVQPMLSIYFGESEKNNIKYTAYYGFRANMIAALLFFLVVEIFAPYFCKPFGMETPFLKDMTVQALRLVGFYAFSAGIISFLETFYICIRKEKITLFLVLVTNFAMHLIGLLLFVGALGMGGIGIFYAITLSAAGALIVYCICCKPFVFQKNEKGKIVLKNNLFSVVKERDDVIKEFHKIVPVTDESISSFNAELSEYLIQEDISPKKRYYIMLCIEELICNVLGIIKQKQKSGKYYADIKILMLQDGSIHLRIRDNLTEWTPKGLDFSEKNVFENMEDSEGINQFGLGIVFRIAKDYSFKRTIGMNDFSVIL